MSTFVSPPALATDPALTAPTFVRNPTLTAALQRLHERRSAQAVNTGAEVPGGSDATDPLSVPPAPETFSEFLIHLQTASGVTAEAYRVRASDLFTAMNDALCQAQPKHPGQALRVVLAKELKPRGAA